MKRKGMIALLALTLAGAAYAQDASNQDQMDQGMQQQEEWSDELNPSEEVNQMDIQEQEEPMDESAQPLDEAVDENIQRQEEDSYQVSPEGDDTYFSDESEVIEESQE